MRARRRPRPLRAAAVGALALVASARPALAHRPATCPDRRYPLASGSRPLPAGDAPIEAIIVDGGTVAVSSGCPAVPAHITASRRVTRVAAHWRDCHGTAAHLVARIRAPACAAMRGVLRVRGARPRVRRFDAAR